MSRNVYFGLGNITEKRLHEDLIIEALRIYGHDILYLPRSIIEQDSTLHEDTISRFEASFKLEAYIENIDGYGGEGTLMSKFGLTIRDQMNVLVSKRRWETMVKPFLKDGALPRPAEGDLIYFPMGKALMEIKYVENKASFYQLQQLPTYRLVLELFEYSGEKIDTGDFSVDSVEMKYATPVDLTVTNVMGTFIPGEKIVGISTDGYTVSAEVVSLKDSILRVVSIETTDSQYQDFTGLSIMSDSGASADVVSSEKNTVGDNKVFESKGNAIIDFTESNPFGDVNYRS